jgi:ABC-type lipoprotein export system ATPase subunit
LLLNVRRTHHTTMMLVTHDADLAALADSRLVLRDGRPVDLEPRAGNLEPAISDPRFPIPHGATR